jgi:hypothetical protein
MLDFQTEVIGFALSKILKDTEGVCVKYQDGQYLVCNEGGKIIVYDADGMPEFEDGAFLWLNHH